jgi:Ca2+-binding RTX toxin-like protein
MKGIWNSIFGRSKRETRKQSRRTARHRLGGWESLEDRKMMACVVANMAPALTINCDGANDQVFLFDDGNNMINGSATGFGAFAAAGITDIKVNTGRGDDVVQYHLVGNLLAGEQRNVTVALGAGNDRFDARILHDLQLKSSLVITAYGGTGNDTIWIDASNDVDVARGARLKVILYGHDGNDTLLMNYRGENDGSVALREASGGAGNDTIRGHLQEDAGSTGSIWGQMHGDDGADVMSLFVITPNAGQKGEMWGGLGADAMAASANVVVNP